MSEVVATVESVVGTVIARDEDGNTRVLQPGDHIFYGEEVIAEDGAFIEMAFEDGSTLSLAGNESATITDDLAESAESVPEDGEIAEATVEEIIAALDRGEDITDLLEAPAAGVDGGPAGEGGGFVRIARNTEEVGEVSYLYGSNVLGDAGETPDVGIVLTEEDAEAVDVPEEFALSVEATVDNDAATLDISGTSTDVPEDGEVTITITDQNDNTVTATATVDENGDYSVADVDVSGLTDGPLTIDAEATDNNGNDITAQDTAELDAVESNLTVNADDPAEGEGTLDISGESQDVPEGGEVA
ncbi:retention module-containing protein, partial [Thioalkalivibrio sp. ALE18]|uniref:retention module-containing protein n=1 Tax=Thioalkalivibrio sp. ALE18 TaxID=1158174 RepID=UPI0004767907